MIHGEWCKKCAPPRVPRRYKNHTCDHIPYRSNRYTITVVKLKNASAPEFLTKAKWWLKLTSPITGHTHHIQIYVCPYCGEKLE